MDVIVSIKNSTDYTPYLYGVQVNNAQWQPGQVLQANDPIAPQGQIVGMLDADENAGFNGSIDVAYGFVAPGPGGATINLSFNGQLSGGTPLVGAGGGSNNRALDVDWDIQVQGNAHLILFTIFPTA